MTNQSLNVFDENFHAMEYLASKVQKANQSWLSPILVTMINLEMN